MKTKHKAALAGHDARVCKAYPVAGAPLLRPAPVARRKLASRICQSGDARGPDQDRRTHRSAQENLEAHRDIGTEIRQICAGIAQILRTEKMIGRKVAVVV